MTFISASGVIALIASLFSLNGFHPSSEMHPSDGKYTCGDVREVEPSGNRNGAFTVLLGTECQLTEAGSKGIPAFREHLEGELRKGTTVNEGPISVEYKGLPAVRYDSTAHMTGQLTLTIRQDTFFANTDVQFITDTLSKEVQGEGLASRLRNFDAFLVVDQVPGDSTQFKFEIRSRLALDKPWYVPAGTIVNEAKKQFTSYRENLMKSASQNL